MRGKLSSGSRAINAIIPWKMGNLDRPTTDDVLEIEKLKEEGLSFNIVKEARGMWGSPSL